MGLLAQFWRQRLPQHVLQLIHRRAWRPQQHREFRFEQPALHRFRLSAQFGQLRSRLRIHRQVTEPQRDDHVIARDQVPRPRREFLIVVLLIGHWTDSAPNRRRIEGARHRETTIVTGRQFETSDSSGFQWHEEVITGPHASAGHRSDDVRPQRLDGVAGLCPIRRHRDRADFTFTDQHHAIIRHRADVNRVTARDSPSQLSRRRFEAMQLLRESRQQQHAVAMNHRPSRRAVPAQRLWKVLATSFRFTQTIAVNPTLPSRDQVHADNQSHVGRADQHAIGDRRRADRIAAIPLPQPEERLIHQRQTLTPQRLAVGPINRDQTDLVVLLRREIVERK